MNMRESRPSAPPDDEPFYVNYLPTPPALRRFTWLAAIALVALTLGTAALVAAIQADPGDAIWSLDDPTTIEGVVLERPYPILRVARGDGGIESVLLVSEGKRGASSRVAGMHGMRVRLRGTLLQRDGRRMFELASSDDAIQPALTDADATTIFLLPIDGRSHQTVLRGEVIDPKCDLGAMKPGEGKTHKACAALCLRGGIPPMFMTGEGAGLRYYLLVDMTGGPLTR